MCLNRGGWWILKVGIHGVKWTLLWIETAVVKGFFSKTLILEDNFWPQKSISQKWAGIRKSWRSMTPPKIEKLGGLTSTTFSNSGSFRR